MKTLDEIKQMTAAGDTAQADEALKELLAKEPDNLQAKMLYGTCRQLLGDEETFKRIHDELAPEMETMPSETIESRMWAKYRTIHSDMRKGALCTSTRLLTEEDGAIFMEYVIIALLIFFAIGVFVMYYGKSVTCQAKYAGPPLRELQIEKNEGMDFMEPKKFTISAEEGAIHID